MILGEMMRVAMLLSLLCAGCAHVAPQQIEASRLPGTYRNGDGFWPRWLDLMEDGTYVYTQMTDVLREVAKDEFVFEGGWSFGGRWSFVPPDRIEMTIQGRPEKVSVIVRPSTRYEWAILEPDLFPGIARGWKDDGSWGYLKKEKPNQAPKPTATPARSAAAQSLTSAAVVEHR